MFLVLSTVDNIFIRSFMYWMSSSIVDAISVAKYWKLVCDNREPQSCSKTEDTIRGVYLKYYYLFKKGDRKKYAFVFDERKSMYLYSMEEQKEKRKIKIEKSINHHFYDRFYVNFSITTHFRVEHTLWFRLVHGQKGCWQWWRLWLLCRTNFVGCVYNA